MWAKCMTLRQPAIVDALIHLEAEWLRATGNERLRDEISERAHAILDAVELPCTDLPWAEHDAVSARGILYRPFDPMYHGDRWPGVLDYPATSEVLVSGRLPLRMARFWRDETDLRGSRWRPIAEAF